MGAPELVLKGKISTPTERLGELAPQIAVEEEAERGRQGLLENLPADD